MKSMRWMLCAALLGAVAPAAIAAADPLPPTTANGTDADDASLPELIISTDRPSSDNEPVAVTDVKSREHADGMRVAYHAAETRIARADLLVAQFEVERTRAYWDHAVAAGHPNAAGFWAVQHAQAVADRKDALGRWMNERAERNIAFADLRNDWDQLHRLWVAPDDENLGS